MRAAQKRPVEADACLAGAPAKPHFGFVGRAGRNGAGEVLAAGGDVAERNFFWRGQASRPAIRRPHSPVPLAKDASVRAALEKFAEDIRFSDPVSSAELEAVESDLSACIDDLQQAVLDNDREAALSLEKRAEMLLAERNRLCKLEKRATH